MAWRLAKDFGKVTQHLMRYISKVPPQEYPKTPGQTAGTASSAAITYIGLMHRCRSVRDNSVADRRSAHNIARSFSGRVSVEWLADSLQCHQKGNKTQMRHLMSLRINQGDVVGPVAGHWWTAPSGSHPNGARFPQFLAAYTARTVYTLCIRS